MAEELFNQFGTAQEDQELGWESVIEEDGGDYVLLAPGEYKFIVKNVERTRFTPKKPDSKIPPCPQAIVHLLIKDPASGKDAEIRTNLFLTKSQEWQLSAFFRAIGQKKRGEPLKMNWAAVPGASGWCEVSNREYKDRKYNEMQRFIDPDKAPSGYTAGSF